MDSYCSWLGLAGSSLAIQTIDTMIQTRNAEFMRKRAEGYNWAVGAIVAKKSVFFWRLSSLDTKL